MARSRFRYLVLVPAESTDTIGILQTQVTHTSIIDTSTNTSIDYYKNTCIDTYYITSITSINIYLQVTKKQTNLRHSTKKQKNLRHSRETEEFES